MRTLARAADRDALVRRLRAVRPESGRRWGRMTPHQMVCHLADAFAMALGERPVTMAAGPLRRTVVKWIALYAPLRWPAGIETSPELDQCTSAGTLPAIFDADVERVVALLERFAGVTVPFAWPPHPVFGRLSPAAWLRWGYLHTDHHLRQFGV